MKAREALYKMGNRILYKIYVYSILCFDGFFLFSEFGRDLRGGLLFIRKLLNEMQCDELLNVKLTESLKSWRWNSFDKTLIAHSVLFGVKICGLVRAIRNRIGDEQRTQSVTQSVAKKKDQSTKDLKALFSEIEANCTVLRQTENDKENEMAMTMSMAMGSMNGNKGKEDDDDILDLDSWIPDIWKVFSPLNLCNFCVFVFFIVFC